MRVEWPDSLLLSVSVNGQPIQLTIRYFNAALTKNTSIRSISIQIRPVNLCASFVHTQLGQPTNTVGAIVSDRFGCALNHQLDVHIQRMSLGCVQRHWPRSFY